METTIQICGKVGVKKWEKLDNKWEIGGNSLVPCLVNKIKVKTTKLGTTKISTISILKVTTISKSKKKKTKKPMKILTTFSDFNKILAKTYFSPIERDQNQQRRLKKSNFTKKVRRSTRPKIIVYRFNFLKKPSK